MAELVPLLSQEVKPSKGTAHDQEIADLKDDLEAIRCFLKDADSKKKKEDISEDVKLWVKEAREVAYRIEDVIDKSMLQVQQYHNQRGLVGFSQRIFSFVQQLNPWNEVASEAQHLRKIVKLFKSRTEDLQFISPGYGASTSNARNRVLSWEKNELVGIESPRDELISLLISGTSQRKLTSVVGSGGMGKTTIAREVYDSYSVKRHFGCRAWITAPQSYDKKQLPRSILQNFYEQKTGFFPNCIVTDDSPMLIKKLNECSQPQRYLVVFDDVRGIDFWEDVERALLDIDNGSRILFTTRNEDVADVCRRSSSVHVHRMKLLTEREAWELFCKKAFKFEFEGKCPEDLEELSHEIVSRCRRFPLAVVLVGGLLSTKEKTVLVWKQLLDSLDSALVGDPNLENIIQILSLCYDDLPYNLKSCLLYLGMFPKNFYIKCKRLTRVWVAEGFVEEKLGMTLEEVAEEYLAEFIHRSLVQVDGVNLKGVPGGVRVHDSVGEVIFSKSEELCLCHISSNCPTFEGIAWHLSINDRGNDNPKRSSKSQTRSIMVFDRIVLQNLSLMFGRCKLLATLDLEESRINHMPKELGSLPLLRYLNLRNTRISELPIYIGYLRKLEFLDLRGSLVRELPIKVQWFPKLRHLLGDDLRIGGSIRHLESLQTLCMVRAYDDEMRLVEGLRLLKQIRKFGLHGLKTEDGRDLCISLEKMTNLWSLRINSYANKILDVQSMSSPPLYLQTLKLSGELERLPEWVSKLHNLSKLGLWESRLRDDQMKVLQALPNVKSLYLFRTFSGDKMRFEEGGFRELKRLELSMFDELNTITIDKGAMPVLEELHVGGCPQLKEVPSGIQHLKGLNQLGFAFMSDDFKQRLSRDGGEDFWIVKHVPSLLYDRGKLFG